MLHPRLHAFGCSLKDGLICPEVSDHHLRELVARGDPIILKSVFPGEQLLRIRDLTWDWSRGVPPTENSLPDDNYHAIEIGVSRLQKTLHCYHSYNFNRIFQLPTTLRTAALEVWRPMQELQNRISRRNTNFEPDESGRKLHPQIIQYPRGGGMFAAHVHALEPQRLGLILAISKRGADFTTGGTGFELEDRTALDTSEAHDLGDMIVFRYDVRHWISFVDMQAPLSLESPEGRWTMVLPYY